MSIYHITIFPTPLPVEMHPVDKTQSQEHFRLKRDLWPSHVWVTMLCITGSCRTSFCDIFTFQEISFNSLLYLCEDKKYDSFPESISGVYQSEKILPLPQVNLVSFSKGWKFCLSFPRVRARGKLPDHVTLSADLVGPFTRSRGSPEKEKNVHISSFHSPIH